MNKLKPTQVGHNLFSGLLASQTAVHGLPAASTPAATAAPLSVVNGVGPVAAARGSARRKLWDLTASAACPVTGVCLRIDDLYKLARKAGLAVAGCSEYDMHVQIVGECRRRSDMAERVQRLLDERYALHIRKAQQSIKATEDLASWWDQSCMGADWAGVLWAVLTHPRCSTELEHVVLGQVHMLQHQVGMASRVEHAKLNGLLDDNLRLGEELELTRLRQQNARDNHARDMARLQADLAQLRGQVIRAQTERDQALAQWQALKDREPGLLDRQTLADDNAHLLAHNRQLRRELVQAGQALARSLSAPVVSSFQPPVADTPDGTSPNTHATDKTLPLRLANQAVLCVGGRTAGIPVYREVIEHTGAHFLHHDGGDEERVAQLGSHLQAADVVICQVGCISHDAYWRVKDHCKRTGKPCLFVESSSRSALERALASVRCKSDAAMPSHP